MVQFPLKPELSKIIINSSKHKCMNEIISLVAMLSVQQDVFIHPNIEDHE